MQLIGLTTHAVTDIKSASITVELFLHFPSGGAQHVKIAMAQGKVHLRARVIHGVVNLDFISIGNFTHQRPQSFSRFFGAHVAHFRGRQFNDGNHTVTARAGIPTLDQLPRTSAAGGTLVYLLDQLPLGLLQLVEYTQGAGIGRARRQRDIKVDNLVLHLGHKTKLDPAAGIQAKADDKRRDKHTHSHITMPNAGVNPATIVTIGKVDNTFLDALLPGRQPTELLPVLQMRQVRRQYQERLKHGYHQRQGDDD